jgi:hypothetical protein
MIRYYEVLKSLLSDGGEATARTPVVTGLWWLLGLREAAWQGTDSSATPVQHCKRVLGPLGVLGT